MAEARDRCAESAEPMDGNEEIDTPQTVMAEWDRPEGFADAQRPDEALRTRRALDAARRIWVDGAVRKKADAVPVSRRAQAVQDTPTSVPFTILFRQGPRDVEFETSREWHAGAWPAPIPSEGAPESSIDLPPLRTPDGSSRGDSAADEGGAGRLRSRNTEDDPPWIERKESIPALVEARVLPDALRTAPRLARAWTHPLSTYLAAIQGNESSAASVHPTLAGYKKADEQTFRAATTFLQARWMPDPPAAAEVHSGILRISPSDRWVVQAPADSPVDFDRVINEGYWIVRGEETRVTVRSAIDQRGHLVVADGARLVKAFGAVVNNGTMAVTNGASFTDADIINARTANAWIHVDGASTVTATRSFINGDQSGVTGNVYAGNGSLVQAGTTRSVNLILGNQGYGILKATQSTVSVTGSMILGDKNGGGGEVHLFESALTAAGDVRVGSAMNSQGAIVLDAGSRLAGRSLYLGESGEGTFAATDSEIVFSQDVVVGNHVHAEGTLLLSNSDLEVGGDLRVATMNQSTATVEFENGSQVSVGGDLEVGGHKLADADVAVSESSMSVAGSATVSESSSFLLESAEAEIGGSLHVLGDLVNVASVLEIASDLRLDGGSRVTGVDGAEFYVGRDFISGITDPQDFNLSGATLIFDSATSTAHVLDVAGADYGASPDAYAENFAIYAIRLPVGQTLTLRDVNGAGGALYLTVLDLSGGLDQLGDLQTGGLNIYYDPSHPGNAYLMGSTHDLDVAWLIPIPEPRVAGLGIVGALLVSSLRRRSRAPGPVASRDLASA